MQWCKSMLCLLLLVAPAHAAITDTNIVVLLDTSGSMAEGLGNVDRMKAAQESLVTVLDKVPETTHIGLITFNGWVFDPAPVGGRKEELVQKIRGTRPNGGTPLSQYTQLAGTRLLQLREANKGYGIYKLLIVTDGAASDSGLETYVADCLRRGIIVSTIGVGMKSDHYLAKQTYYMRADDPATLVSAVTQVVVEAHDTGNTALADFSETSFTNETVRGIIAVMIEPRNYPIGSPPPKDDPPLSITNDQGQTVVLSNQPTSTGGGWSVLGILGTIGGVVVLICIAGAVISSLGRGY